jgi:hypothetical protein
VKGEWLHYDLGNFTTAFLTPAAIGSYGVSYSRRLEYDTIRFGVNYSWLGWSGRREVLISPPSFSKTKAPASSGAFFMSDVRNTLASMTPKELEQWEQDLRAAELALKAAQEMPGGAERIAALKRAGQLRFDAYEKKRAIQEAIDKESVHPKDER